MTRRQPTSPLRETLHHLTTPVLWHARAGQQGHDTILDTILDTAMAQRYARDVGRALDRSDIDFRVLHSIKPGRSPQAVLPPTSSADCPVQFWSSGRNEQAPPERRMVSADLLPSSGPSQFRVVNPSHAELVAKPNRTKEDALLGEFVPACAGCGGR